MSATPAVSVIIIFLNEEKFLREAIDSVLTQTHSDWELLLVDDGSTDESPLIARSYASDHPEKIKYLTHPQSKNQGMSASRNLGIRHAQGTYVSYLDGDDVWLPNKLERQLQLLAENPQAEMVYGPVELWYSWTGDEADSQRDFQYGLTAHKVNLVPNRIFNPPELLRYFLRHKQLIPTGIIVKKDTVLKVGGYEEQFKGNYEDAVFLTKLCLQFPVFVSGECWYRYRQHPDSCTKQLRQVGKSDQTQLIFLKWVEAFLQEHAEEDELLKKSIQSAKWPLEHPHLFAAINKLRNLKAQIWNLGKRS